MDMSHASGTCVTMLENDIKGILKALEAVQAVGDDEEQALDQARQVTEQWRMIVQVNSRHRIKSCMICTTQLASHVESTCRWSLVQELGKPQGESSRRHRDHTKPIVGKSAQEQALRKAAKKATDLLYAVRERLPPGEMEFVVIIQGAMIKKGQQLLAAESPMLKVLFFFMLT